MHKLPSMQVTNSLCRSLNIKDYSLWSNSTLHYKISHIKSSVTFGLITWQEYQRRDGRMRRKMGYSTSIFKSFPTLGLWSTSRDQHLAESMARINCSIIMCSLVSKINEVHGQEWTVRNRKSSILLTTMVPYVILRLWKWADWHWYHPTNHRTWFTKDYGLHNSLLINSILRHPLMEGVRTHTCVHLSCVTWQAEASEKQETRCGHKSTR